MFIEIARYFNVQSDLPFRTGGIGGVLVSSFFFFTLDAIAYPLFGALSGLITASLMGQKPKTGTGEITQP